MDTKPSAHRCRRWFAATCLPTSACFKFNIFDGQPRFRRWLPRRSQAFRGQGHRHHRRGHRRQDRRAEFAGARQGARHRRARRRRQGAGQNRMRGAASDGLRADYAEESTEFTAGGRPCTVKRLILAPRRPAADPRAAVPRAAGTGPPTGAKVPNLDTRRVTHLLVDAARGTSRWSIRAPATSSPPPAISFTVVWRSSGAGAVLYERGLDLYVVELTPRRRAGRTGR